MAKFKITPTTTVAELKEQFRNEVGCVLRVYQGRSEASDGATLVSLGAKEGELECRTSRTVGKFEEAFQNELNLKVKVYTKDNWVKVLDGITLAVAGQLPNGMTKAKMEEHLSYKRDEEETAEVVNEETTESVEVPEENCDSSKNLCKVSDDILNSIDEDDFRDGLAYVNINDKYGYVDRIGNIVISPKFDSVRSFRDGIAEVCINDKYGYIDKTGKFVIEPIFDCIDEYFCEGYAKVCYNDMYGCIDKDGNFIIEPKFDYLSNFNDDLAIAKTDGKCGFINIKGEYVIEPIFEHLEPFHNGFARAKTDGKFGFINIEGEYVIEPIFDELPYYFDEESMPAQIEIDGEYKYGFIDKYGNFFIEPIYDYADEFWHGIAEVRLNDEEFKIDMQGNRVEE